jgi:hypothetical protein
MMIRYHLVLVLSLLAGLSPAAAQPTGRGAALEAFLEQRVAEELAADGTILSRLGVALDVDAVGDRLVVSLVDLQTRRAVASTKLDRVPADREAAVASVTQVAANLAAQLRPGAPAASSLREALEDDRRERRAREQAELAYKREAIRFTHLYLAGSGGAVAGEMVPYRGERRLSAPEFFHAVDRPDLARRYSRRRTAGWALAITGMLTSAGSMGPFFAAVHGEDPRLAMLGGAMLGAGFTLSFVGIYYVSRANPVGERDMHDMADAYNAALRGKHGLPRAAAPRRGGIEGLALAPYVAVGGSGLALGGRF